MDSLRYLDRLVGVVVKASASRVADPGFNSCLLCGDFSGLSHTSDLKSPQRKRESNPGSTALKADALTTRPTRQWPLGQIEKKKKTRIEVANCSFAICTMLGAFLQTCVLLFSLPFSAQCKYRTMCVWRWVALRAGCSFLGLFVWVCDRSCRKQCM